MDTRTRHCYTVRQSYVPAQKAIILFCPAQSHYKVNENAFPYIRNGRAAARLYRRLTIDSVQKAPCDLILTGSPRRPIDRLNGSDRAQRIIGPIDLSSTVLTFFFFRCK